MLKLRWLKGKAISPVGIRRIPIQRLRGRSARSSDDALGNLRGAKGLTYQGCQIWSTYEIYFTGTNRNFNPSSIAKWRDTKSSVMGDYQARFCERLRGETPLCLLDLSRQFKDLLNLNFESIESTCLNGPSTITLLSDSRFTNSFLLCSFSWNG